MKRWLSRVALLMAMVMVLSACGGNQSSNSGNQSNNSGNTSSNSGTQDNDGGDQADNSSEVEVAPQQLTIGTASSGGAFYVVGTGLAEIITQNIEPLNVTAEITGGSAENVRLVGTDESDLGISNSNDVYFGYTGTETFEGQSYDLQAICSLHSSVLHIVTTERSGISSIGDLAGKKVAVGPAGGGSIYPFEKILDAYGLNFNTDITPSYLSYDDGIEQLKDGQVDCALVMAGLNASSILSLQATDKVVLLSIEESIAADICEACPFYYGTTVPSSVYGTDGDAYVLAARNVFYCSSALDENTVYAITKAIVENLDALKEYHASLKSVQLEEMTDVAGVPMHPGAQRYFEEADMLK